MPLRRLNLGEQVLSEEMDPVFPLRLDKDDARQAKASGLAPGEHLAVVDAAQDYFECEVVSADDALPLVRIARHAGAPEEGPEVMLVLGVAQGDKMETVIRQATELGVYAFLPLACERSAVRLEAEEAVACAERWQAVARGAALQSGRARTPEVSPPLTLEDACALLADTAAVLVCWEEAPRDASLAEALERGFRRNTGSGLSARVAVVVGPEGGLTRGEVDALLACNEGASLVSLGGGILRTETAGVVAPALVLYELGALGGIPERVQAGGRA